MDKKLFDNYLDFRRVVPELIANFGENLLINRLALANPIIAFEMMGLSFTPDFRRLLEYRIRFGPEIQEKLVDLEKKIFEFSKTEFDIRSDKELVHVLTPLLFSPKPSKSKLTAKELPKLSLTPIKRPLSKDFKDSLIAFRDQHPVIPLLLEYRRIEGSAREFAEQTFCQELLKNEQQEGYPLTFSKIGFRMKVAPIIVNRNKRK